MTSSPTPSPERPNRRNLAAVVACIALLASFFAIAYFASLTKSAAFDEPFHFVGAWIQTHYGDFRCNPEDPPLWKYYVAVGTRTDDLKIDRSSSLWNMMLTSIPAAEVNYACQILYQQTPPIDADKLLGAARIRMLVLAVILGAAIGWWAWRLRGPAAAIVAVAAFCLDPNFLAHSPLVKDDVPITMLFFMLMGIVWLLGERASLWRISATVMLVAICLTTKFSGLLAFAMLGIALICRVLIITPWPFLGKILNTRLQRLAGAIGVLVASALFAWIFIWANYGFRFSPVPSSAEHFSYAQVILDAAKNDGLLQQHPPPVYPSASDFQNWVNEWKPDPTVQTVKLLVQRHVLPEAWLFGFLYTYATSLARRTFLCGRVSWVGWWYYFPAAIAFKTPLATLIGLALASFVWLRTARFQNFKSHAWAICAILTCPVLYMIVAMRSHLNIGLRHIFPVYPFLFVFLGVMAARGFATRPKLTRWIVAILFLGLAAETLAAYPNYIPFFNIAAGGSRGGLSLLSDSNIDWGQELPALAAWQHEHQDRQLYFCEFGLPDPRYYGIHYINMDGSERSQDDQTTPNGFRPVYAISAVALQGPYMTRAQIQFYSRFLKAKPIDVLNGSIYLYDAPAPE